MAGLKMLFPNPPKDSFTTPIANRHPSANIHNGKFDGTLKAKSTPVIIAEPSKAEGVFYHVFNYYIFKQNTENHCRKSDYERIKSEYI